MSERRFLSLVEGSIRAHWDLPALSDVEGISYTYEQVAIRIEELHLILSRAGVVAGDKVALLGGNSANWALAFFATLSFGATVVPILATYNTDNIEHIVNHSDAQTLFVSSDKWKGLSLEAMPHLQLVVCINDFSILYTTHKAAQETNGCLRELFTEKYPQYTPQDVHWHKEDSRQLAVINYTSGTTSYSKGVMLSYGSLWSNAQFAIDNMPFIHAGDNIVCLLPMAHMYGLMFEVINSVCKGCHVHFITGRPSPQLIINTYRRVHPRIILIVPLIIERAYKTYIKPKMKKRSFRLLMALPIVSGIIRRRIRKRLMEVFGGNFAEMVIGGAALNGEVEQFLKSIAFPYTVGYGMTECGPLIAYAQWNTFARGSVGRVVDRMEVRIHQPEGKEHVGEIWVRGDNVMLGYYKNPEATEEVLLPDGWMRTGDMGMIDKQGNIYIRGRCKALILGPNGQNIYPEEIEERLNALPLVRESLVVSDGRALTALIYPDWAKIKQAGMTDEEINKLMNQYLRQVNHCIPRHCRMTQFRLHKEEFAKTSKRSIKRNLYQPKLS